MLVFPLKVKLTISKTKRKKIIHCHCFAEEFSCGVLWGGGSIFSLRCAIHLPEAQKLHPK